MVTSIQKTLLLLALTYATSASAFDHLHVKWADFLRTHVVSGAGQAGIRYAQIKSDESRLQAYLAPLEAVTESEYVGWSVEEKTAFLINAYNAASVKLIVDHFPLKSVQELGRFFGLVSPFKKASIRLFGKSVSASELQTKVIELTHDPRVHFALACPAKGCPVLRYEPYLPQWVNHQLDDAVLHFLKDIDKNRVDPVSKTMDLSALMKSCWWSPNPCYGNEIIKKFGSVEKFVVQRLVVQIQEQDALIQNGINAKHHDVDWTLNSIE